MFARAKTVTNNVQKSMTMNMFFAEREVNHLKWVEKLCNHILLGAAFDGELDPHKCELGKWYYALEIDGIKDQQFRKLYQALEEPHKKLHETGKRILELSRQGDMDAARNIYATETLGHIATVQALMAQMKKFFSDTATADKSFLLTQINTTQITIIVFLFGAAALGIIIAFLVARGITGPLQFLERISKRMAAGELKQEPIKVTTTDELGKLIQAFSLMNRSLAEMVLTVLDSADKVAAASQDMSSSSQQMNASTQEISQAIMRVSKGATAQAAQLEEATKIMEKSAADLTQMVSSAQTANQTIERTSSRLTHGMTVVQEATKKIEQLSETVLETTKVVQNLGASSQKISEITETITAIADQTNLLALNAAIEAARAGEAGRGFAVVAEEVRKLAEGSAKAVGNISALINLIQAETENAVSAIQKSSKTAQEGKSQISDIIEILAAVKKMAAESSALAKAIVTGGEERVQEITRASKTIQAITTIAQESASSTLEISSSTQQQTASMEQLSALAQELSRLAKELKESMGKFKV
jgi:methyl-accepting chemotaxis protein